MFRLLGFLLLCASLAPPAPARIFTSTDGRELEARIVAANDTSVVLRRDSDEQEFTLALTRLSASDRAHVAAWLDHLSHPLGWKRLRIHGNGQTIAATCLPVYGPLDGRDSWPAESNATLELTLPVGAWIQLGIRREGGGVEGLVQYDGAPDWHLSARDDVLTIKSGPQAKTIHAVVQCLLENFHKPFSRAQEDALRAGASLTTGNNDGSPVALPRTSFTAAHLHVDSPDWSQLPDSMEALQIDSRNPINLAGIERFQELTHLGIAGPSVSGLDRLLALRKLRSLYLKSDTLESAEYDHLSRLVHLRHLFFSAGQQNTQGSGLYTFLSPLTKLESLALAYGPGNLGALDPGVISNSRNLTRLDFVPRGPNRDDYLRQFPLLTDLSLAQVDPITALDLMQSGHLQHLHTVRNASFRHPLTGVPKLRNVQFASTAWPREEPAWDELPFLENLQVHCPTAEVLQKICSHPAFQTVRHVTLRPSASYDLSALSGLPELRSLKLESGRSEGPLDLSPFARLHTLNLSRSMFSSIPTLHNLKALRIDSPLLERMGDGSPTSLTHLEIIGSRLRNLDGLADSPRLHSLLLHNCRELESHSGLAKPRNLESLHVAQCPKLPPLALR